jgi:V/A-type H+-transporting ATPase subunit I
MMKYSFILLSGETEGFLTKLQELGVVDVTRSAKPIDDRSARMLDNVAASRKLIGRLESLDYTKDTDYEAIAKAYEQTPVPADAIAESEKVLVQLGELELDRAAAEKDLNLRRPWGDFDKKRLDQLKTLGYTVRYYTVNRKVFSPDWTELYPLEIISEDKNNVWFVTIAQDCETYSFPVEAIAAPEGSWKEAEARLDVIKTRIIEAKAQILRCREVIPHIKENCNKELADLDLYLAKASTESAADNLLNVLEGFAPVENDAELSKTFDEMGILYIKEEAKEDDNPPIKLKNNWFIRQFEVFTEMYGAPVYAEFDPTPIVAPFYLLFFAMCMGDAGYGLILILLGIAVAKKWINIAMLKNIGPIISILGAGTFAIGLVLGTAFGIDLSAAEWYPQAMKKIMITGTIAGFPAQMILALGIGIFHICLAMTVKAIGYTKRFGFRETVSV